MRATTVAHQDRLTEVAAALRASCPPEYVVGMDRTLRADRQAELRPDVVAVKAQQDGPTSIAVEDVVLASEILPSPGGEPGRHTCGVFSTDRPCPVALDLPALTERRGERPARVERGT
jgi:hypothetical protein